MKTFLTLLLLFSATLSHANSTGYKQTLSAAAKIIEAQFYSKSVGEKVSKEITNVNFSTQFSKIKDNHLFAELVSKELRLISGDNHIGIVYSPDDVKRYQIREQAKVDKNARKKDQINYEVKLTESKLANFGIQQIRVLEGGVGYIEISYFDGFVKEAAPVFKAAMDFLDSSNVIILDLRRNGGGNSRILPLFLGYFLGPEPVHFADKVERWRNKVTHLYTDANVRGSRHTDKPIYILTSGTTFSLAEHVTYHLKAFGRVTIVGERTYGGGKAFDPVVLNDDFYLRLPRIEMINKVTGTLYQEGKGISPDILTSANSALEIAYKHALEHLGSISREEELKQYYRWVDRIVVPKMHKDTLAFDLPNLTKKHIFEEFVFEIRQNELWMSFRDLPWVKLINLGNGYFYDDRSIQRQFLFKEHNDHLELHVFRLRHEARTIKEQN